MTGFKEWLNADSQKLTNNGGNDIVAAVSALGYDGYMVALEAIKAAGFPAWFPWGTMPLPGPLMMWGGS